MCSITHLKATKIWCSYVKCMCKLLKPRFALALTDLLTVVIICVLFFGYYLAKWNHFAVNLVKGTTKLMIKLCNKI